GGVIGEAAREIERLRQSQPSRAVDAVRQHQTRRLGIVLALVAVEAVGACEPSQRGKLGVGEPRSEGTIAWWQRTGKRSGEERRLGCPILVSGAEQGKSDGAVSSRQ